MPRFPGTLAIAAVGKLRTPHWQAAQADYLMRLRHYIQVEIREVRDVVGGGSSDDVAVAREGEALLKSVEAASWVVALDATGRQADSVRFAQYLRQQLEITREVAFIIGGSVGLAPGVLERANDRFSLSMLTFPHELARVILLEQLYRGMTILSGAPYHK
jgi:23S rRNA (pseudouridine1915-N3)-methyltransferase